MNLPAVVQFQNHSLKIHARDGKPWLSSADIGIALGYFEPKGSVNLTDPLERSPTHSDPINRIYSRNADEFTDEMTSVIRLPTAGGIQDVRVFSHRGCYMLGFFAKTERAKAFRVWVLDVLEGLAQAASNEPALSMPHSIQHRADAVVSASRTFGALLRAARLAGISQAKGLRVALNQSQRLTGVDLGSILEISTAQPGAETGGESLPGGHYHTMPKADAVRAYCQTRTRFAFNELLAEVFPGEDSISLRTKVGHFLQSMGYRHHRARIHCPVAGKSVRTVVYYLSA